MHGRVGRRRDETKPTLLTQRGLFRLRAWFLLQNRLGAEYNRGLGMPSDSQRPRLETRTSADFAIIIGFKPDSPDPSRVFRSMTQLIAAFQRLDRELVRSIDVNIEPVLLLEDVETGSVKSWLRSALSSLDDSTLKDGDWKKVVGRYLVKAKYLMIDFLDGNTEVITRKDIDQLQGRILSAAQSTGVRRIPIYAPPAKGLIVRTLEEFSKSIGDLQEGDTASFETSEGERVDFGLSLRIAPKDLEELIVEQSLSNDEDMILKIKKPDFLGDSQWEFVHEHAFEAKVQDTGWLADFRSGRVPLQPGAAIRAKVRVEVGYGYEREVVSKKYQIIKVYEVIPPPDHKQSSLLEGYNE